jgi:hypothetical protein
LNAAEPASLQKVLERVAKQREALRLLGVPQDRIEGFALWAGQNEMTFRIRELEEATKAISEAKRELGLWMNQGQVECFFKRFMEVPPEETYLFMRHLRRGLQGIEFVHGLLVEAGASAELIKHLADWIIDAGALNLDRLDQLEAFAKSLKRLPFSAASKARHWRAFLDKISDGTQADAEAARTWIAQLEGV